MTKTVLTVFWDTVYFGSCKQHMRKFCQDSEFPVMPKFCQIALTIVFDVWCALQHMAVCACAIRHTFQQIQHIFAHILHYV